MDFGTIRGSLILPAVSTLVANHAVLIRRTERTLAARLAIELDRALGMLPDDEGYVVDVEYERARDAVKRFSRRDGRQGRKIVPDILVHRRSIVVGGQPNENLLVIEIKPRRALRPVELTHDDAKLRLFTGLVDTVYATPAGLSLDGGFKSAQSLPDSINPYRFGLQLTFPPEGAMLEWYSREECEPRCEIIRFDT